MEHSNQSRGKGLLATKGRRIFLFFLLIAGGGFMFLKMAGGPDPEADKASQTDREAQMEKPPDGFNHRPLSAEKYDGLINKYGGDVRRMHEDLQKTKADLLEERKHREDMRKEITTLRGQMEKQKTGEEAREAGLLKRVRAALQERLGGPQSRDDRWTSKHGDHISIPIGLQATQMKMDGDGSETKDKDRRTVHIPTGSMVQATLINGPYASTSGADEDDPVLLRIDAAVIGPNGSRVPLRGAYLVGQARGDANSERVRIQITGIAYVTRDGRTVERRDLRAWVLGSDRRNGVPGTYEWRATELLPMALGSEVLSAGTDALALAQTATSLTPLGGAIQTVNSGSALKYAGFRGLSGGSKKLSDLIVERMKDIRPAVSVKAGAQVTVVFLEGVTLEGLYTEEIEDEIDNDPFRGLDIHR